MEQLPTILNASIMRKLRPSAKREVLRNLGRLLLAGNEYDLSDSSGTASQASTDDEKTTKPRAGGKAGAATKKGSAVAAKKDVNKNAMVKVASTSAAAAAVTATASRTSTTNSTSTSSSSTGKRAGLSAKAAAILKHWLFLARWRGRLLKIFSEVQKEELARHDTCARCLARDKLVARARKPIDDVLEQYSKIEDGANLRLVVRPAHFKAFLRQATEFMVLCPLHDRMRAYADELPPQLQVTYLIPYWFITLECQACLPPWTD